MKKRILGLFLLNAVTVFLLSCSQSDEQEQMKMEQEVAKNNFVQSIKESKSKLTKNNRSTFDGRLMGQPEIVIGDEEIISFETGDIVGDINDTVTIAYGPTVYAITEQEELETKAEMLDQIDDAKNYLNTHGLDFSNEFTADDPKYIYAAMIVNQMEETVGIPGESSSGSEGNFNLGARQNTVIGCVLQATGINTLYEAWFSKFATKRLLIAAVGKIASRYLGYVGAAIAVIDFVDCMWGGD